jgi:hypothetical protein
MSQPVQGPDGNLYQFPDGTSKEAAIGYFRKKGIGDISSVPSQAKQDINFNVRSHLADVPRPKVNMQRTFEGDPDIRIGSKIMGNVLKEQGASMARMTYPGILYVLYRAHQGDPKYREIANNLPNEIMFNGLMMMAGGMEAEGESPLLTKGATKPVQAIKGLKLTAEQQEAYTAAIDKANARMASDMAKYQSDTQTARAEWVNKAYEHKAGMAEAERVSNRQMALERGSETSTKLTMKNVADTHTAVKAQLDARWDTWRRQMAGTQVDATKISQLVNNAKAEFLRGSPPNVKQFNDLMKEIGVDVGEEGETAVMPGKSTSTPIETAQVHYSSLGEKLSGGGLPGNVYQAMKYVREGIGDLMGQASESRGMGSFYEALKKDYSQFMNDWHDTSSTGSPLAKILQAKDWPAVQKQINGPAGDRLLQTMSRYRRYGAKPVLPQAVRQMTAEADALAKPRIPAMPKKLKAKTPPELEQVTAPKPKAPRGGAGARLAGRVAGKIVGGKLGSMAGHPLIGYGIGGEAGERLVENLQKK